MRKKWTALAVVLCLLLSGCGGAGAASSAPAESTTPAAASEQAEVSATETNVAEAADSQATANAGDIPLRSWHSGPGHRWKPTTRKAMPWTMTSI